MTSQETIRLTKKQAEAYRVAESNRITLYGGAIRGGKSYWLLILIFTYALKYENSRWAIIRKNRPRLVSTLMPTFNELISHGLQQYIKKFNHSNLTVTLYNGSEIIFMSENYDSDKELNAFRGLEVNGFAPDEINELQEVTFNKMIERAGSWQHAKPYIDQNGISHPCKPKIIATCNPANNWVKELFYDRWKDGKLPAGWAYVPAKITDNPVVMANIDYVESLKLLPKDDYEIFVLGNWDMKIEGVLFSRSDFKRFSSKDLKDDGQESVLAYADIADEGDDFFSMPLAKIYKGKIFITDILFTDENIDITLPLCASTLKNNKADYVRIESNNQGSVFIKMLRQHFPPEKVLKVNNSTNKHTRILLMYAFIKEYVYFLNEDEIVRGSHYDRFMSQLLSYMKDGSAKHDDAADSLSGLAKFIQSFLPHLFQ